jgi:hypothetical protein
MYFMVGGVEKPALVTIKGYQTKQNTGSVIFNSIVGRLFRPHLLGVHRKKKRLILGNKPSIFRSGKLRSKSEPQLTPNRTEPVMIPMISIVATVDWWSTHVLASSR